MPAVFLIRLVAGAARQAGLSLRAHLKRFDRLIGAGSPKLEIELEATVYADGARQPLWTKSYFHHQGSDAGNLRATAAAIQAALANMLYSMVEDPAEKDLTP